MTATTARPTTPPDTMARRARIGFAGALLWLLSPVVWYVSDLESQAFGSLAFVAVAVAWWICMVAAPLLLVVGHLALRRSLGSSAGRVGAIGIGTAATGLAAMGLGIGIEVASMSAGGGKVALGHYLLMIGFLVSIVGALLTGITVMRRRADGASRAAGGILVIALPLGLGIGLLGNLLVPQNDASFWAALTVPTAIAWLVLSHSLGREHPAAG